MKNYTTSKNNITSNNIIKRRIIAGITEQRMYSAMILQNTKLTDIHLGTQAIGGLK